MNRRGEQQNSPRAQHYAIRRHCTIGGDADAPSPVEGTIGTIFRHANVGCAQLWPGLFKSVRDASRMRPVGRREHVPAGFHLAAVALM
jgi:hypothetical protein